MRRATNRGFTLVELLVVIGIIALLISILLPSLNKARQAAARLACSSQMRQLGIGMQMYLNEFKSTYPAAYESSDKTLDWFAAGQANQTWFSLLRKYMGDKTDPNKSGTLAILQCPNDNMVQRVTWLTGGTLSYNMPTSYAWDTIYPANAGLASGGAWHRVSVGQVFTKADPSGMRVRANMVKPSSKVILLLEDARDINRQTVSYPQAACVDWPFVPSANAVGSGVSLHEGKFNYLFCDGHAETLSPKETVRTPGSLVPYSYQAATLSWTVRPDNF